MAEEGGWKEEDDEEEAVRKQSRQNGTAGLSKLVITD